MKHQHEKKPLRFTKMHGLGNDFAIINALEPTACPQHLPIKDLANRHTGIGFDQLIIIEPAKHGDFFCRIFNADGSEAEQCGNGLRCVARYIHEEGLHPKPFFRIETKAGVFPIEVKDYAHIRVSIDVPFIEKNHIELSLQHNPTVLLAYVLSIGNPHAIIPVEFVESIMVNELGKEIASHIHFPEGVNVGFMQIVNHHHIRLRTFERGVGETHACGSNACAAVCTGIVNGWLHHQVKVEFRYGSLAIEWEGNKKPLHMIGPAERIFYGVFLYNLNE